MSYKKKKKGKRIFEEDVPRLIKAIENTNIRLEEISEKLGDAHTESEEDPDDGLFGWASFDISDTVLEEAESLSMNDEEDVFSQIIMEEMSSDTERETSKLLHSYRMASPVSRRAIDAVSVFLTGWSMATLIERYVEQQKQKTEGAWKTQNGFLSVQRNTEGEWDYTLYTPDYKLFDGGLIDDPDITIAEVRDQILSDFGWSTTDLEDVEYELLEAAVDN